MLRVGSVAIADSDLLTGFLAAGYKAIFLTVDCPILGIRYNEYRNDFVTPDGFAYPNLSADPAKPYGLGEENPDLEYGMHWFPRRRAF